MLLRGCLVRSSILSSNWMRKYVKCLESLSQINRNVSEPSNQGSLSQLQEEQSSTGNGRFLNNGLATSHVRSDNKHCTSGGNWKRQKVGIIGSLHTHLNGWSRIRLSKGISTSRPPGNKKIVSYMAQLSREPPSPLLLSLSRKQNG